MNQQANFKDFFPISPAIAQELTRGLHLIGKNALEPQAGKGDLVDFLQSSGANVTACEIIEDLAAIVSTKCEFLKYDFFNVGRGDISHMDYIIMNPPFSTAEKHINYAWDIAPEGCIIRALMNSKTYYSQHTRGRSALGNLIKDFGKVVGEGRWFAQSERQTDVDVICIELVKPSSGKEDEWAEFFDYEPEVEEEQIPGIMGYDVITSVVNRVVESMKKYEHVMETAVQMEKLCGDLMPLGESLTFTLKSENVPKTRDTFRKQLQKGAWQRLFKDLGLEKFFTQLVQDKVNKFAEHQSKVPFTVKNVRGMFEVIFGTSDGLMKESYVDVFERLTSHYHDNQYKPEGWKTNSHYMINRKMIVPHVVEVDAAIRWGCRQAEIIEDLYKVLCHFEGEKYDDKKSLYSFFCHRYLTKEEIAADPRFIEQVQSWYDNIKRKGEVTVKFNDFFETQVNSKHGTYNYRHILQRNTWYDWTFFEIKFYKKGTMHLKWKDEGVWRRFNKLICEINGLELPTNF